MGPVERMVIHGTNNLNGECIVKRLAVIWCELDTERDEKNFSRELANAMKEYADLVLDFRAGQRHVCEYLAAKNGVQLKVISANWSGELAPQEVCPHCLKSGL